MALWNPLQLDKEDVKCFIEELEPFVERLILVMNALPFLRTFLSCGGHIERDNLYHKGIIFYIDENSREAKEFVGGLEEIIEKDFRFARLIPLDFKIFDHPVYKIEVDCLIYPEEWKERREGYYKETYSKLHSAVERLVNKWLKITNREEIAKEWLKEI